MDPMTIALLGSAILGAISTGYNAYNNYRDRKYQENLQEQMFAREDNSVQRRVEDLEAAGINRNLAAGTGAGAGAVVSRSNTNDVDFGSMLDMMKATGQLDLQKQETENAKIQHDILVAERNYKNDLEALQGFQTAYLLGSNPEVYPTVSKDGVLRWHFTHDGDVKKVNDTPYGKMLLSELSQTQDYASIINKQNNWFTTNQIIGALGNLAGSVGVFTPKFTKRLK